MKDLREYEFFKKLTALPFVKAVYLYGSRARNDATDARTDIDLAVLCPTATSRDWQKVLDIIENADTLLKIDCIRLDTVDDERLRSEIARDKVLLYG
jgi:predicted nucleotidyltransferase